MEQTKEVSLLAKFDEFAAEIGSANKAANRIGIPASTMSMLKKGTYNGNKDAQFAKLAAYFDTKTEGAESYSEVDYAPTSISEKSIRQSRPARSKVVLLSPQATAVSAKQKLCRNITPITR